MLRYLESFYTHSLVILLFTLQHPPLQELYLAAWHPALEVRSPLVPLRPLLPPLVHSSLVVHQVVQEFSWAEQRPPRACPAPQVGGSPLGLLELLRQKQQWERLLLEVLFLVLVVLLFLQQVQVHTV